MNSIKHLLNLLLILLLVSCNSQKPELEHPNIVWITSEDNSKHYMELFDPHGVSTPNIEQLADHGITFTNAFSNAAVCSAARSTLISGCYGPRMASHYHRQLKSVPMPDGVEMFPAYLKQAGYYTTNNAKEDYNILKSDSVWDVSSKEGSWRNRAAGQPFFHVFNIGTTHESRLHFSEEEMHSKSTQTNPDECFVQPNHPNTNLFKYTNAYYRDKVIQMDKQVGEVIAELEKDSLMDDTFIFYFGDHGGVLPGSKGYIFETGVHVPLVVYIPEKYKHLVDYNTESRSNGFVSFVDFGATVLSLAGIEIPEAIDGKAFLGKHISKEEVDARDETYSYADRFDEKYDMVRAVRKGQFKYIRNYQPFNFDGLMNNYRYKQMAYTQWNEMYHQKNLNNIQSQFFLSKTAEALYDIENDPFETNNLASNPDFSETLKQLRSTFNTWSQSMPDLSFYPEHYLIQHAFDNPVAFGQLHKKEIANYKAIADLALTDFDSAKTQLENALHSTDSWQRYWALISCCTFKDKANGLSPLITKIATSDDEMINRVRAAEYLAIAQNIDPTATMSEALYQCKDANEALLILNSVVLMQDGFGYAFELDKQKIPTQTLEHTLVEQRLIYLKAI